MKFDFDKQFFKRLPLDVVLSLVIWILISIISFVGGMLYEQGKVTARELAAEEAFDVTLVQKTYDYVKGKFYKSLDKSDDDLLYGAMGGIVNVLHNPPFNDPYSGFFDPEHYQTLEAETTGEYAGIGVLIEVSTEFGYPQIMKVFRDSPAAESGLKKDDFITAVDDVSTESKTLQEVGKLIMGEKGTIVTLTITDSVSFEARKIEVARDRITIHSVEEARMLSSGLGYILLTSFQDNTTLEMIDAMDNLMKLGMKKLILDLRGNGGGTLDNAVDIASMFIPDGETVTTLVYRTKEAESKKADTKTRYKIPKYDIPVILLVDSGSASASEVLSGALRDHGKAILVGDKTFGKGKVQQIYEISNKYRKLALVLTVATYYTPAGRDIDGDGGLDPDLKIGFDDYRNAIPRLGEIEKEVDNLRKKMISLREEIVDSIGENDIVLKRVQSNFDTIFKDGVENRKKLEEDAENAESSDKSFDETAIKDDENKDSQSDSETDGNGDKGVEDSGTGATNLIQNYSIKC